MILPMAVLVRLFGFFSSTVNRLTRFAIFGQVPPQLLVHAFLGIDVAIDRFRADAQSNIFIYHQVADLFERFKTRAISRTGTFACHQSSIVRRCFELNCV